MKQALYGTCCILLILFINLSACQIQPDSESSLAPVSPSDAWRDVYFSETHSLSGLNPYGFYDVTVNKVFSETFPQSSCEECLLIECKIKHIFYQSPPTSGFDFTSVDEEVFLWVNVTEYSSDTISLLTSLFESVDSAIIYGYQITPYIIQNSALCKQLESELGKEYANYFYHDGLSLLKIPPSIIVYDLESWAILPIIDGSLSADSITSVLGARHMAFSLDLENPDGLQYFKNGDDVCTVYDAIDRFVSEILQ